MTREQKKQWAIGAAGVAIGVGITVLATSKFGPSINIAGNKNQIVMGSIITVVKNAGRMRKIVHCVETDEWYPSVSQAAEVAGVSLTKMSQHINGHKEHVNGLHYVAEAVVAG